MLTEIDDDTGEGAREGGGEGIEVDALDAGAIRDFPMLFFVWWVLTCVRSFELRHRPQWKGCSFSNFSFRSCCMSKARSHVGFQIR